jgi:cell division protein ZapE
MAAGVPIDALFDAPMRSGGFRLKYRRAQSRLIALRRRPAGTGSHA